MDVTASNNYHHRPRKTHGHIDQQIRRIYQLFVDEQNWVKDKYQNDVSEQFFLTNHLEVLNRLLLNLKNAQLFEARNILSHTYRNTPCDQKSRKQNELIAKHLKEKAYIKYKLENNDIIHKLKAIDGKLIDETFSTHLTTNYDYDTLQRDLIIDKILGDRKDKDDDELENRIQMVKDNAQEIMKHNITDSEMDKLFLENVKDFIGLCNEAQKKYAKYIFASEIYLTTPSKVQRLIDDFLFERQTQQIETLKNIFYHTPPTYVDVHTDHPECLEMFIKDFRKLYQDIKNEFLESDGDQLEKEFKLNLIRKTRAREKELEEFNKQDQSRSKEEARQPRVVEHNGEFFNKMNFPPSIYHILSKHTQSHIDNKITKIYQDTIDKQKFEQNGRCEFNQNNHLMILKDFLQKFHDTQKTEAHKVLRAQTYRKTPIEGRSKKINELKAKHLNEKYYVEYILEENEFFNNLKTIDPKKFHDTVDIILITNYDKLYDSLQSDLTIQKILGDGIDNDFDELKSLQVKLYKYAEEYMYANIPDSEMDRLLLRNVKRYINGCNEIQKHYATKILASEIYLTSPSKIQKLIGAFLYEKQSHQLENVIKKVFSNREESMYVNVLEEYPEFLDLFIKNYRELYEDIKTEFLEAGDQQEKEYKSELIRKTKAQEEVVEENKKKAQDFKTGNKTIMRNEMNKMAKARVGASDLKETDIEFMYKYFVFEQEVLASEMDKCVSLHDANEAQMNILKEFLDSVTAVQIDNAKEILMSYEYQSGSEMVKTNLKHEMKTRHNRDIIDLEYNLLQNIFLLNKDHVERALQEYLIDDYDELYAELEFAIIFNNITKKYDDEIKLENEIDNHTQKVKNAVAQYKGTKHKELQRFIFKITNQFLKDCTNVQKEFAATIFGSKYYEASNEELEKKIDKYLFRRQTHQIMMLKRHLREPELQVDAEGYDKLMKTLVIDLNGFYENIKDDLLNSGSVYKIVLRKARIREKAFNEFNKLRQQESEKFNELTKQSLSLAHLAELKSAQLDKDEIFEQQRTGVQDTEEKVAKTFREPVVEQVSPKTELDKMLKSYENEIENFLKDIKVEEFKLIKIPGITENLKKCKDFTNLHIETLYKAIKSKKYPEALPILLEVYENVFYDKLHIDFYKELIKNVKLEQYIERCRLSMDPNIYEIEKAKVLNEKKINEKIADDSRRTITRNFFIATANLWEENKFREAEIKTRDLYRLHAELLNEQKAQIEKYKISVEPDLIEDAEISRVERSTKEPPAKLIEHKVNKYINVTEIFNKMHVIMPQLMLEKLNKMKYDELETSSLDMNKLNKLDKNTKLYLDKINEMFQKIDSIYKDIDELRNHKRIEDKYTNIKNNIQQIENDLKKFEDPVKIEIFTDKLHYWKETLKKFDGFILFLPAYILMKCKNLLLYQYEVSGYEYLYENVIAHNPTDQQEQNKKKLENIYLRRKDGLKFSKMQLERAIVSFSQVNNFGKIDITVESEIEKINGYFEKLKDQQIENFLILGLEKVQPLLNKIKFSPVTILGITAPTNLSIIQEEFEPLEDDAEMTTVCSRLIKLRKLYPTIKGKFSEMVAQQNSILQRLAAKINLVSDRIKFLKEDMEKTTSADRRTQLLNKIEKLENDFSNYKLEVPKTYLNRLLILVSSLNFQQMYLNIKLFELLENKRSKMTPKQYIIFEKGVKVKFHNDSTDSARTLNSLYETAMREIKKSGNNALLKIANNKILQQKTKYDNRISTQIKVLKKLPIKRIRESANADQADPQNIVSIALQRLEMYPKLIKGLQNVVNINQSILKDQLEGLLANESEDMNLLREEAYFNIKDIYHSLFVIKAKKNYYSMLKQELCTKLEYKPTDTEVLYNFIQKENFCCLRHNIQIIHEYLKLFLSTEEILELDIAEDKHYKKLTDITKIDLNNLIQSNNLIKHSQYFIKTIYEKDQEIIESEICNLFFWKFTEFPTILQKFDEDENEIKILIEKLDKNSPKYKIDRHQLDNELFLIYLYIKDDFELYYKLTEIVVPNDKRCKDLCLTFGFYIRNKIHAIKNYLNQQYKLKYDDMIDASYENISAVKLQYESIKEIILSQYIKIDTKAILKVIDACVEAMDTYNKKVSEEHANIFDVNVQNIEIPEIREYNDGSPVQPISIFFEKEFDEIYNYGENPLGTVNKLRKILLSYNVNVEQYNFKIKGFQNREEVIRNQLNEQHENEEVKIRHIYDFIDNMRTIDDLIFNRYILELINKFDECQILENGIYLKTDQLVEKYEKDVILFKRELDKKLQNAHEIINNHIKLDTNLDKVFAWLDRLERTYRNITKNKYNLIKILREANDSIEHDRPPLANVIEKPTKPITTKSTLYIPNTEIYGLSQSPDIDITDKKTYRIENQVISIENDAMSSWLTHDIYGPIEELPMPSTIPSLESSDISLTAEPTSRIVPDDPTLIDTDVNEQIMMNFILAHDNLIHSTTKEFDNKLKEAEDEINSNLIEDLATYFVAKLCKIQNDRLELLKSSKEYKQSTASLKSKMHDIIMQRQAMEYEILNEIAKRHNDDDEVVVSENEHSLADTIEERSVISTSSTESSSEYSLNTGNFDNVINTALEKPVHKQFISIQPTKANQVMQQPTEIVEVQPTKTRSFAQPTKAKQDIQSTKTNLGVRSTRTSLLRKSKSSEVVKPQSDIAKLREFATKHVKKLVEKQLDKISNPIPHWRP